MDENVGVGVGPAERARHAGGDGPTPEHRCRMSARRKQDAVLRLQQAVQADPDYLDARYNFASALAFTGQFAESARQFEQVVQRRPNDADAEARLGSVLAAQQDYAAAEAHLRRALSLDPNNQIAKDNLRLLQQVRVQKSSKPQ